MYIATVSSSQLFLRRAAKGRLLSEGSPAGSGPRLEVSQGRPQESPPAHRGVGEVACRQSLVASVTVGGSSQIGNSGGRSHVLELELSGLGLLRGRRRSRHPAAASLPIGKLAGLCCFLTMTSSPTAEKALNRFCSP